MQRPFSYHIYKSGFHSIQERDELQSKQIELHFFILLIIIFIFSGKQEFVSSFKYKLSLHLMQLSFLSLIHYKQFS